MAAELKIKHSQILKKIVLANLEYWRQVDHIPANEQENLHRLVSFGIQADECRAKTINFVQKIFPVIESWGQLEQWIAILTNYGIDPKDRSYALQSLLIGKLYEIRKDAPQALEWYLESEKNAGHIKDRNFSINLYSGMCFIYWGLDEIKNVDEYRSKLNELLNDWNEADTDPAIQMLLGQLALITENYIEAKSRYTLALKLLKGTSDHQKIASSAVNLALSIYLSGQIDAMWRCLGFLAQAAQIYQDIGNFQDLYRLELLKGLVYFRMGEKDRAVAVLSNIRNTNVESFDGYNGLMWSKLSGGLLKAFSGDYETAKRELRHSVRLAEEAGEYSVRTLAEQSIKDFGD